jgi:dye decolorizing peroxidase
MNKALRIISAHVTAVLIVGLAVGGVVLTDRSAPLVTDFGSQVEPFYGVRQNGIETASQANLTLIAFDLKKDVDKAAAARFMRVWTTDAAKLTQGLPVTEDVDPGMEKNPARLTATFGFGFSFFEKLGIADAWPVESQKIPAYPKIDKLQARWSDGDIVVQIGGNDPLSIYHLGEVLKLDAAPFASVKWQQRGFVNAAGVNAGVTGRNLMGQMDGSGNPVVGTNNFDQAVWDADNGTVMVVRRIAMNLDLWNSKSLKNKGESVGRNIADGKPLYGGTEKAEVIKSKLPANSHVRLSERSALGRIFRHGYNYDDGYSADGARDAGLIFISFQESLRRYIDIQNALAKMDALNKYTTPIGSALFYVPKGLTSQSQWLMQDLLN